MSTEAARFNSTKPRMSLVPGSFPIYAAYGLTYGAIKYSTDNWRRGFEWRSLIDSLERHLMEFKDGHDYDAESGLPHLALMACNLAFLIEHFDKGMGRDDRYVTKTGLKLSFNEPPQRLSAPPPPPCGDITPNRSNTELEVIF